MPRGVPRSFSASTPTPADALRRSTSPFRGRQGTEPAAADHRNSYPSQNLIATPSVTHGKVALFSTRRRRPVEGVPGPARTLFKDHDHVARRERYGRAGPASLRLRPARRLDRRDRVRSARRAARRTRQARHRPDRQCRADDGGEVLDRGVQFPPGAAGAPDRAEAGGGRARHRRHVDGEHGGEARRADTGRRGDPAADLPARGEGAARRGDRAGDRIRRAADLVLVEPFLRLGRRRP